MVMTKEEIKEFEEAQKAYAERVANAQANVLAQRGLLNSGVSLPTPGTIASTSTGSKYKTNLHWMEQQALELWGYAHMPTEGVVWQNIYAADGSVVAVRGHGTGFVGEGGNAIWHFKQGREIKFYLGAEEIKDNGQAHPRGDQPFPLWLQRERDAMEKRKRWWRFWRR